MKDENIFEDSDLIMHDILTCPTTSSLSLTERENLRILLRAFRSVAANEVLVAVDKKMFNNG